MKVVFAHDHIFYKDNKKYYSNGGLSLTALERYTRVFDELIILSRQKKIKKKTKKLTLSSGNNIKFVKVSNSKSLSDIYKYKEVHQTIKQTIKKTDYLVARLPSTIGEISVKYARKYDKPYLIELVGCPWDAYWNHSFKGKIIAPIKYLRTKKIVKEAKHVLYVTNKYLQNKYPTIGKTVSCSNVLIEQQDEKILKKRINKISKLSKKDKVKIGTIGSIEVRYKGQQHVIKSIGKLKEKGISNLEYQLVGNGDSEYLKSVAVRNNVSEQVKILGSKPNKEVLSWLDEIDIYIQPSETEGLPRALIEAMSRALPAIGARAGGIPELLDEDFIYKNDRNRINNIIDKISSYNELMMEKQAIRNFEESLKYQKEIIEKRRNNFLINFKRSYKRR